ncbi:MAG TPA: hypothetical protein PKE34_04480, partial [Marmoricola sp.]|nr:hypothetical protein [Marmoricola sp.]
GIDQQGSSRSGSAGTAHYPKPRDATPRFRLASIAMATDVTGDTLDWLGSRHAIVEGTKAASTACAGPSSTDP